MTTPTADAATTHEFPPIVSLLLNIGHGIDHMFLLIFATAVASMAADFGATNWTDLMPYSVGAFVLFGLGALPAGRLGDLWGRRNMMIIFFVGMGVASMLVALTQNSWQLAAALMLLGAFASIYHPVGIPMLVQNVHNPGEVIGFNGLAGNLGIAVAAVLTGLSDQMGGLARGLRGAGPAGDRLRRAVCRQVPARNESRRPSAPARPRLRCRPARWRACSS